jgi:hypothetical protein
MSMRLLLLVAILVIAADSYRLSQPNLRRSHHLELAAIKGKLPDLRQTSFPDIPDDGYDLVVVGSGPGGVSEIHREQFTKPPIH